jgi:hypothetical protein
LRVEGEVNGGHRRVTKSRNGIELTRICIEFEDGRSDL